MQSYTLVTSDGVKHYKSAHFASEAKEWVEKHTGLKVIDWWINSF